MSSVEKKDSVPVNCTDSPVDDENNTSVIIPSDHCQSKRPLESNSSDFLENIGSEPQKKKICSSHQDEDISTNSMDLNFGGTENLSIATSSPAENNDCLQDNMDQMEFNTLDEFDCTEENDEETANFASESDESSIDQDEIDAMLDASLPNFKRSNADTEHEDREKFVLKIKGQDHFDVLPEDWIEVTHDSGMPMYLHKPSRVCCVSKPYFLGPGSTRKHEIPISAIPCLQYLKASEKEKESQEEKTLEDKDTEQPTESTEGSSDSKKHFPFAKLESVKESRECSSLDVLTVREYCKKRFEFDVITIKRFKTWSGRRKHEKMLKKKQRPFLPDSTKLITCPVPPAALTCTTDGTNTKKAQFVMNPSGKTPVCILHEYVQHTLRVQPVYVFKELENANTPYGAVVTINNMEYGSGFGSSKKQAKSEAAKAAIQILFPKMKMFTSDTKYEEDPIDVEFFDEVRVEDPRVCDLSIKAGHPYPYQILLECLKRNYGMGDTAIDFTMNSLKHQKNEFQMKVGKHQASVVCKNKRDGKHRASQAILQMLHPHIKSWGSLLRMYGKGSCKTLKEKKEEEQQITELQNKACANKPNVSILNKLKEEMLKYKEKMHNKKPIGKIVPQDKYSYIASDVALKNVEL